MGERIKDNGESNKMEQIHFHCIRLEITTYLSLQN